MSTIKAILEVSADGTLHLPLPPELRQGKVSVVATVEPAPAEISPEEKPGLKGFGCLKGKIWISDNFDEPLEDFRDYLE